jgi:parallel beta-helix repeat protein
MNACVHSGIALALVVCFSLSTAASGGSLMPPGAPGATMKPLSDIEPRVAIRATSIPLTIDSPGSYYFAESIRSGTLNTPGITITTHSVSVDLNGFVLTGPGKLEGSSGHGIVIISDDYVFNISVVNGTVSEWRESGVKLNSARNSVVREVRAKDNGARGIELGDGGVVSACVARENGTEGIFGSGGAIVECTAMSNGGDGIECGGAGLISRCVSGINTGYGIHAGSRTNVVDCQVSQNTLDGIYAEGQCLVTGNDCCVNTLSGIRVASQGTRVEGNNLVQNTGRGIKVDSVGNVIIRNSARGNSTEYDIVAGNFTGTIVTSEAELNSATNSNVNIDY